MRCPYCNSERVKWMTLKNGSDYEEIVHLPSCVLLKRKKVKR